MASTGVTKACEQRGTARCMEALEKSALCSSFTLITNTCRNVLARLGRAEIGRWDSHAVRHRLLCAFVHEVRNSYDVAFQCLAHDYAWQADSQACEWNDVWHASTPHEAFSPRAFAHSAISSRTPGQSRGRLGNFDDRPTRGSGADLWRRLDPAALAVTP